MVLLLGATAFAQATRNVIYSGREDLAVTRTVPCLGELNIEISLREKITEWVDGNGGYHFSDQGNVSRFSGVDAQGTEYSGAQAFNVTFHIGPAEFPQVRIYTETIVGASHGSGPNLVMQFRRHLTINAPGEITVYRDIAEVKCLPE
jgi:hypothetical protein